MIYLFQILLGALQGLTEFLPVSSSGHLALLQSFFNEQNESLLVEITAHFGSLMAIFFYYRKSIFSAINQFNLNKISTLLVSVLPAGIAGLLLKEQIAPLFSNLNFVGFCFLVTSVMLVLGARFSTKDSGTDWPTHRQALIIGLAQALALFPGVSRSGSTISTGVALGIKPKAAAFFSFCSLAPLIGGAACLTIFELLTHSSTNFMPLGELATLLISSFFFGWIGLLLVIRFLEGDKFHYFAFYLVPLAFALLIWENFI